MKHEQTLWRDQIPESDDYSDDFTQFFVDTICKESNTDNEYLSKESFSMLESTLKNFIEDKKKDNFWNKVGRMIVSMVDFFLVEKKKTYNT